MTPIINHHYTIPYAELNSFDWNTRPIDIITYKPRIIPKLPRIIQSLQKPYNDRQAVIVINGEESFMSCLLTIQFQKVDQVLYVIANYRSQCEVNVIRVSIATVIIFIVSFWIWNGYIRKDRHEITLKHKIQNVWHLKEKLPKK